MHPMTQHATILIVDDQQDLRENLMELLREEGYHVLDARDGQAALERLETAHVDLVIADIAMPRMNGYQLLEQMLASPAWRAIPLLFLSARTLDSDVRYGKELGADDYLIKPLNRADLLAAVRGRLRRSQQALTQRPVGAGVPEEAELALGRLRIAPAHHQAFLDGHPIELSAREFRLLLQLARRPLAVASFADLLRATHDLDAVSTEAGVLLRPLVRSLRRKLGYAVGEDGPIETVRGVGYRLRPLE